MSNLAKPFSIVLPLASWLASPGIARASDHFVDGSCAQSGDGSADGCAAAPGGAGAWTTLAEVSDAPLAPGDRVRIHAGTYNERFWPTRSGTADAPIVIETFGDGDVIIDGSGVSLPQYTGVIYSPDANSIGHVADVNYFHLHGSADAWFVVTGSGGQDGLVVYGGPDGANGIGWSVRYLRAQGLGLGAHIQCSESEITDSEFVDNGQAGMWVFPPAHDLAIRRSRFTGNSGNGGNTDGVILQDVSFVLLEDVETSGQYDGLDIGSQGASPGCSYIIARRVRSHGNGNTNFPSSTTVSGPLTYEYCVQWDNHDWGSSVTYENSRNTYFVNNVFADVSTGINYFEPPAGVSEMAAFNNIFALDGGTAIAGNGGNVDAHHNRLTGGEYQGVTPGEGSSMGPVGFVDAASNDYHLSASDTELIDHGDFFTRTSAAGSDTNSVPTTIDPRTFFWRGDVIQIEGAGRHTVVSMTATEITLDASVSFDAGAGVHLPWEGDAPDIGAFEFCPGECDPLPGDTSGGEDSGGATGSDGGGSGAAGADSTGGDMGATTGSATAGASDSDGGASSGLPGQGDGGTVGCGCRSQPAHADALLVFGVLALRRRTRRS